MFPQVLAIAALLPFRVNLLSLMTFFCYWVGKSALCLSICTSGFCFNISHPDHEKHDVKQIFLNYCANLHTCNIYV